MHRVPELLVVSKTVHCAGANVMSVAERMVKVCPGEQVILNETVPLFRLGLISLSGPLLPPVVVTVNWVAEARYEELMFTALFVTTNAR